MGLQLKFAVKFPILTTLLLLFIFTRASFAVTISELSPAHSRPYLFSETYRSDLQKIIDQKLWAKQNLKEIKVKATDGDGFSAAFLFALTNEQRYLTQAKKWLLNIAKNGGDLGRRALNADTAFFKQGMPWLGDVYYNLDTRPLQAFDYLYNSLTPAEREFIHNGLSASARFRKNAMDTWWQTPNLVFKPTSMVAIHGLLTQDQSYIDWGFFRKSKSNLGGYFSTLNSMLRDNGPWNEAPIYAISHRPLSMSLEISDYLNRLTGKDWFNRILPGGSSVRGLMDYYIKTTYPAETRPNAGRAYRILTYGDGATGQYGDLYLISDNPYQRNLKQELASAYKITRDPDYAAFLKLDKNYQSDLLYKPELPVSPLLPMAPSSIWKNFGLAFLRSDNSRGYWNNPDSIAASLLFRQGYGHGHSDALSITLFAAGQLFYPDYNAVQYENPAIGWTASSIAHNTVVVDSMNSSLPKTVNTIHEFNADLDVVQAQVSEPLGISKIRTLALAPDYLLDIFHINSLTPRTFDYLLHSFGKIQTNGDTAYLQQAPFSPRYGGIKNFKAMTTDEQWSVNFKMDLEQQSIRTRHLINQFIGKDTNQQEIEKAFGIDNTNSFKPSGVSIEMAAQANTEVGIGEDKYGLSFLAARRRDTKNSTFITIHSPFYTDGEAPGHTLETLIDNRAGTVVKITTDSSIDIHAVSHLQGKTRLSNHNASILVEFTDYAYLRVNKKTLEFDQGGNWQRFSFSARESGLKNAISSGIIDSGEFDTSASDDTEIQINSFPELVVLKDFADSAFTLSVTNLTSKTVNASLTLAANAAYRIPRPNIQLGLIPAYQTHSTKINLGRYNKPVGIDTLPIQINLDDADRPINHGIMVSAGPGLIETYDDINSPSYRIHTFNSSVDISMREGAVQQIRSNMDKVIYSGQPLFAISDGQKIYSSLEKTIDTSYTWPNKEQASVITEINNRIRWHLLTIQDRFYLKLDDVYTRPETVTFIFDKHNTVIDWKQTRFLMEGKTQLLISSTAALINARAFELPLKGTDKSICINNLASMQWLNNDDNLGLLIKRNNDEQWSFGVCENGTLATWIK